MPITLHYLDHNLRWDKSRDKKLLDHGPDLSAHACVMRDKTFAFCSLDDESEKDHKTLRIHRYSIPSGREVVQDLPCSVIPHEGGQVLGLKRMEHVLTDGLSLYVKLKYRAESSWVDEDGDAPILVSRLPVLIVSDNTIPLTDAYGCGYWDDHYGLYSNGNTHAYFDGTKSLFLKEDAYYTHQLYEAFTCKDRYHPEEERSFANVLLPKQWPESVRCPYTDKFHFGSYPPVLWQGKVLTRNQNTGVLKFGVYPAWWEDEAAEEMLREI